MTCLVYLALTGSRLSGPLPTVVETAEDGANIESADKEGAEAEGKKAGEEGAGDDEAEDETPPKSDSNSGDQPVEASESVVERESSEATVCHQRTLMKG